MILVMKGADFSNNPNAVNVRDFPVIEDGLVGYYTPNKNITVDPVSKKILKLPSFMVDGPDLNHLGGTVNSPVLFTDSTAFKGNTIRFDSGTAAAPGLATPELIYDLTNGASFTFIYSTPEASTGSNRVMFAIESIKLQLRVNATSGVGHLQMGNTGTNNFYDVGLHGFPGGTYAITLALLKNSVKFYKDGALLQTVNITAENLPDTASGITSLGSNWAGSSALINHQAKQFHIHDKELSLAEVHAIHAVLPTLVT